MSINQTENCGDIKVVSRLSVQSGLIEPDPVLKRLIVTKRPSTISFTTQHASVCFWGIILFSPRLHLQTHYNQKLDGTRQNDWKLKADNYQSLRLQTIWKEFEDFTFRTETLPLQSGMNFNNNVLVCYLNVFLIACQSFYPDFILYQNIFLVWFIQLRFA